MTTFSFLVFNALVLFVGTTFAQTYQWAIGEGGANEDRAFGITTDNSGNVFVTGSFKSTATFGNFTFNNYSTLEDIFLVKYDSTGTLLWAKQFGGTNADIAYDVVTDNDGNCYVTGTFYNQATFGAITIESTGSFDYEAFVFKTDDAGTVIWAKNGGGVGLDESRGIAITSDKLYITGLFTGAASFSGATVTSAGSVDVYVACYNLSGVIQWVTSGGGSGFDFGLGVASDGMGNAYATGYFQGQATFGTTILTNTSPVYIDMFVFKIEPTGNILWAHSGGTGGDDDAGRAIAADNAGNVYVAGELRGSGQFDGISFTSAGIADMYVAKYDASGNIQYLTQAGSQGGDYGYGIVANSTKVSVTGLFIGVVQFGITTLTSDGSTGPVSNDIYLATIDANSGSFTNAMRAGGIGNDAGRAVAMDLSSTVVQAGDFEYNNSTFDPFILNTNGTHDMFAARIGPTSCSAPTVSISATGPTTFCTGESVTLTTSVTGTPLIYYQWKNNGVDINGATANSYSATTLGEYRVSVSNACGGAMSNIISITLKQNPNAVISPSGTVFMCAGDQTVLTANAGNNLSYQWIRNTNNINGATNSIYAATAGGKYSVKVTRNSTGCSRISAITKVKIDCKITPEVSTDIVIEVYPNPSANEFTVKLPDGNAYGVQISDALGRILKSYNHIEGSLSFGSDLIPGIYLLQINFNNSPVQVVKLIKTSQ